MKARGVTYFFHQAGILDGPNPVDVFDILHPAAKIEAAGVLIDMRPAQANEGLNLVAELDFARAAGGGRVKIFPTLHPQADLTRDRINAHARFDALRLNVKLRPVSGAIGGGNHLSVQPHGIIQVHAPRFQKADMVWRKALLPAARRRDASEHHAGQSKPYRRPAPARAQEDQPSQNAGGGTDQEPVNSQGGSKGMRPHNP